MRDKRKVYITDRMVLIGCGLAGFYWLCETFVSLISPYRIGFFQGLFGAGIDEIWTRVVVLCLFAIFGSHAQVAINERENAEQALRVSEKRYRTLVENLPIGMFRGTFDGTSRFLMANPACVNMLGYGSEEGLKSRGVADIFMDPEEFRGFINHLQESGSVSWMELRLKKQDGGPLWAAVVATLTDPEAGAPCFDCMLEDIHERKLAQERLRKEEETRQQFERLLSPDLARMVASGRLKVEKGGENREATVLFADIRGFTSMSENTEAEAIVRMLNEYYEGMVEVAFRYEGSVDKFIGDAVMVNWGAPVTHQDDPRRAVQAALDMQAWIQSFNRSQRAGRLQPISVGIGINSGQLVAGYIGSSRTMSYSVIGDTVNIASRLCSAAQGGQVLISQATRERLGDGFFLEPLPELSAKGKYHAIRCFAVKSPIPEPFDLAPLQNHADLEEK